MRYRHRRFNYRQNGFSFPAMLLGLVVIGAISQGFNSWNNQRVLEKDVSLTRESIAQIEEGLYAFYEVNDRWPTQLSDISPYVPNLRTTTQTLNGLTGAGANGVGTPFYLENTASGAVLHTQMDTLQQARLLVDEFKNTGILDASNLTVSVGVAIPGVDSIHNQLLDLAGTRAMTGNLNLDGNDINNVNTLRASRFIDGNNVIDPDGFSVMNALTIDSLEVATVSRPEEPCTSTLGRTDTGSLLSCVDGSWVSITEPLVTISPQYIRRGSKGTLNLGVQDFCAITFYRSDSEDDGTCGVTKSGDNWTFRWTQESYVHCGATCMSFGMPAAPAAPAPPAPPAAPAPPPPGTHTGA